VMRRDKVYPKEWALLWKEVEERMTELEKKLIYSPNRDLVGSAEVRESASSQSTVCLQHHRMYSFILSSSFPRMEEKFSSFISYDRFIRISLSPLPLMSFHFAGRNVGSLRPAVSEALERRHDAALALPLPPGDKLVMIPGNGLYWSMR